MTDLTVSPGRDRIGRLTAHGRELLDRAISEVRRALLPHLDNTRADCRIDYTSHDCCHTCNLVGEVLDVAAEYVIETTIPDVTSVILQAPVERTKAAQEAITRAFTEELDVSGLAKNHGAPIEYTVTKSEAPLVGRLFMKDIGTAQLVTGTMKECPSDEAITAMLDAATPGPLEAQAIRVSYENAPRLSMVLKYTPSSSHTEKMEIVAEKLNPDDAVLFSAAPMLIRVLLARARHAEGDVKAHLAEYARVCGQMDREVNEASTALTECRAEREADAMELARLRAGRQIMSDEIVWLNVKIGRYQSGTDIATETSTGYALLSAADALGMSLVEVVEAAGRAKKYHPPTGEPTDVRVAIATQAEAKRTSAETEVLGARAREKAVRTRITAYFDSLTDYDCAPDAESKAAARLAIGVALRALHAEAA